MIEAFAPYDYVVVPSGSCAGMLAKHYPALFAYDPDFEAEAQSFAAKVYELSDFLVTVLKVTQVDAEFPRRVTYHDACSGLRELGIAAQPRELLGSVRGLDLVEMDDHTRCCGFGGTFAVKYGEISAAIVDEKADSRRKKRRAGSARGRPRLPDEYRGPVGAQRQQNRSPSFRRSARGNDRSAGDLRGAKKMSAPPDSKSQSGF